MSNKFLLSIVREISQDLEVLIAFKFIGFAFG